jgi:hypothetical protein
MTGRSTAEVELRSMRPSTAGDSGVDPVKTRVAAPVPASVSSAVSKPATSKPVTTVVSSLRNVSSSRPSPSAPRSMRTRRDAPSESTTAIASPPLICGRIGARATVSGSVSRLVDPV